MEQIRPKVAQAPVKHAGLGGGGDSDTGPQTDQMATVTHGPYAEQLPVAGMTVEKIRKRFADRFEIHKDAQAIIDGNDAGNDQTVKAGQTLMFVRRSGEKGASDSIVIEGTLVKATTPEGIKAQMPLVDFLSKVAPVRMSTGDAILPEGVRAVVSRNNVTVWVHEKPPHVASFKWIDKDSHAPYGPGTKYRIVRLSMPYTLVFAVFQPGSIIGNCECFFRNDPLEEMTDQLYYPALLNVSKFPGGEKSKNPLAWICTQYINLQGLEKVKDQNEQRHETLNRILTCLYETGFNRSSEHHEGQSWFGESSEKIPQISTVEKWEKATEEDNLCGMDIKWLPVGMSVQQVIERILTNHNAAAPKPITTSSELAQVIFNGKRS